MVSMNRATRNIELTLLFVLTFILLIFKYLVNLFRSTFPSFPDMLARRFFGGLARRLFGGIGESREKGLDYPVKSEADLCEESLRPDNDNHCNILRYE
jgi:hypothetical protein